MRILRLTIPLILSVYGGLVLGQSTADFSLEKYNVVWDSPSRDSSGSMPLGNGDIGANVWVEENGDLVFYVGGVGYHFL